MMMDNHTAPMKNTPMGTKMLGHIQPMTPPRLADHCLLYDNDFGQDCTGFAVHVQGFRPSPDAVPPRGGEPLTSPPEASRTTVRRGTGSWAGEADRTRRKGLCGCVAVPRLGCARRA